MAKYTITAPVKKSCFGYGLNFVDGVATTEDKRIAEYLKTKGYKVSKKADAPNGDGAGEENPCADQ